MERLFLCHGIVIIIGYFTVVHGGVKSEAVLLNEFTSKGDAISL